MQPYYPGTHGLDNSFPSVCSHWVIQRKQQWQQQ